MGPQEGHFRRLFFRVDKKTLYSFSGNKHPPGLFIRYHVQRKIHLDRHGKFASHT
ncbi:hypothetical protein GCM10012282_81380 [Streptomyces lacrimifluminis]|uniref:Uncharacterized protein n=1 Tax=Streptomyces lacrimifluminis TaxID=1500077 RepID=A0A917UPC3_9ACTN|nr:hypothetical protein GCM10012282_81380 [Streptomyces lacrimifluminis]